MAFFYLLIRDPGAFHSGALPSPRDSKSFISGQWKQRERLCSEVTHIATSYIPLGRMILGPHLGISAAGLRTLWLDRPFSVTVPHWGRGAGVGRMSWWWTRSGVGLNGSGLRKAKSFIQEHATYR